MTLADQCVKRVLLSRASQSQGRSHQRQRPGRDVSSQIPGLGSSCPRTCLPGQGFSQQYGLALCMMAYDDSGGSMCEARSALSSIAKPGAIAPTPASRQGRWFPLVGGNSVVLLCRLIGSLL